MAKTMENNRNSPGNVELTSKEESTCENAKKDGVAKLKSEFIIQDHKRVVSLDYVSSKDKKKFESGSAEGEPAKKKLKGQNKKRPREQRVSTKEKLCPNIVAERKCDFGERCHFSHDIEAYVAKKPQDIGKECYLFQTFGRCNYGVTCRFGSCHLTSDFKNIVNDELCAKQNSCTTSNFISQKLQILLRKRKYDFSRANKILNNIRKSSSQQIIKINNDHVPKSLACNANVESLKETSLEVNGGTGDASHITTTTPNSESVISEPKITEPEITEGLKESSSSNTSSFQEAVRDGIANTLTETSCSTSKDINIGSITDEDMIKLRRPEIKKIDFNGKLYLAPLTTVGNLPFRRICKNFGVDITCGEMAVCTNLLQGQKSEWALLRRHQSEDLFGVQVCGSYTDVMMKTSQLLMENTEVDFVDINVGCPIDFVYQQGAGCGLMNRVRRFEEIVLGMKSILTVPLTVKIRTGVHENKSTAHQLIPQLRDWGVNLTTMHGRSREQRYTKQADWDYIDKCAKLAGPMPFFGNGDILSYEEYYSFLEKASVSGIMIGRGALFKPWIFTEIKERRHWDISSTERFDMLKDYVHYGLEQWGADSEGVEKTRRFLLEWLSFLYRYIPVGILEYLPQKINERPPIYRGRDELETLMASPSCADWVKISEMLLGPVPENFVFLPKHKANSYSVVAD